MKRQKEAPKVDVSRGLPNVNESRGGSNWKAIIFFVVLALGLGGGAAYLVYLKLKGVTQGMTKPEKVAEEKSTAKPRVFGPQPAAAGAASAGDAGAASGAGTPAGKQADSVSNPFGAGAPPPPPPLGTAGGGAPPAPGEAKVPAIAVTGGPTRPAPLKGGGVAAGGMGGPSRAGGRETSGRADEDRSRFDTPFVVNGALQPGGRSGATSQLDDVVRKGNEAIAAATAGARLPAMIGGGSEGGKGALSGMLTPTSTPAVRAGMLSNLSLTIRKGTPIECVLSTKIVAQKPGLVRCRVTSHIYSANGKVILIERGSDVVGEQNGTLQQGDNRLYVLWTEIDTPEGVTIQIDSPGTDALGAAGLDGEVDNRWGQRIGASLMLSVIDDAFAYQIAKAGASSGSGTTSAVPYQNTQQQGQRIAEKVLDSTINIKPVLYINQGEKIGITLSRHLDFSMVYSLEAK